MSEKVRVQFYVVDKCGYYNDADAHQFCSFTDVLGQVNNWARRPTLRLRDLKTFQCADEFDPPTVYLADLWHDATTGDYLMATWNEAPNTGGSATSLRGENAFGQAVVDSTSHPVGNILGYATYFWLLPSRNLLATIKTESETAHNGHRGLCRFISGFLARFSDHAVASSNVVGPTTLDVAVEGYRQNSASAVRLLELCFESRPARRSGPLNEIRHQRAFIRKIIYRHKLTTSERQSRRMFQKFLVWITGERPPELEHTTNFRAEMLFNPTEDQLEHVINRWQQTSINNWNNVGFKLKGNSAIIWLSGLLVRKTEQLEVERTNGVLDGAALLTQLIGRRPQLLALLGETQ